MVVSVGGKARVQLVQVSIRETNESEPFEDASLKTDRKSTRLNSSHGYISYAVFCLKKKKHSTNYSPRSLDPSDGSNGPCLLTSPCASPIHRLYLPPLLLRHSPHCARVLRLSARLL